MSQFEDFIIFYNQLFNILSEVEESLEAQDYNTTVLLVNKQKAVIEKIVALKQHINFSTEENAKIVELEKSLSLRKDLIVEKMEQLKSSIKQKIEDVDANEKLNEVYMPDEENETSGGLIDLSE